MALPAALRGALGRPQEAKQSSRCMALSRSTRRKRLWTPWRPSWGMSRGAKPSPRRWPRMTRPETPQVERRSPARASGGIRETASRRQNLERIGPRSSELIATSLKIRKPRASLVATLIVMPSVRNEVDPDAGHCDHNGECGSYRGCQCDISSAFGNLQVLQIEGVSLALCLCLSRLIFAAQPTSGHAVFSVSGIAIDTSV